MNFIRSKWFCGHLRVGEWLYYYYHTSLMLLLFYYLSTTEDDINIFYVNVLTENKNMKFNFYSVHETVISINKILI